MESVFNIVDFVAHSHGMQEEFAALMANNNLRSSIR